MGVPFGGRASLLEQRGEREAPSFGDEHRSNSGGFGPAAPDTRRRLTVKCLSGNVARRRSLRQRRRTLMRGRVVPLSWPRRLLVDAMSMTMDTPSVGARRVMALGPLVAARKVSGFRPSWSAIMTKAYAMTAQDLPELRRVYLNISLFVSNSSSVAYGADGRSEAGENFSWHADQKSGRSFTCRDHHAHSARPHSPIEEVEGV